MYHEYLQTKVIAITLIGLYKRHFPPFHMINLTYLSIKCYFKMRGNIFSPSEY